MKLSRIKLLFTLTFFIFFDIVAQKNLNNNSIDCDSLLETTNYRGFMAVEMPSSLKPFQQIQNEFISRVDTNRLIETIYIKAIIDTNGRVLCPEIIKGNNNITDSVALSYVMELKFTPANQRGKKLVVSLIIPFFKWSLNETSKMIKINRKWTQKNNIN